MKNFIQEVVPYADIFLVPFVYPSAWLLKFIRNAGLHRLPLCKNVLLNVGIFPIRNDYYEPQFDMRNIRRPFSDERSLPGINWNIKDDSGDEN